MAQSYERNSTIVGYFPNSEDAFRAVSELRSAGFSPDEIGIAIRGGESGDRYTTSGADTHESKGRGFWKGVKDFFGTGEEENHANAEDFRSSMGGMNISDERANYYYRGILQGGALVTVNKTGREEEARRILQDSGADLRENGFEAEKVAATEEGDKEYRVQLRGEMLKAHKERVPRGEVKVRKEVVSENRSIEVPVKREELVIERTDAGGQAPAGEIGDSKEIRVPLSEERVTAEKTPVVTGEVRVGKRTVEDTKTVSDTVRHEEPQVEKKGDVEVNDEALRDRTKKAA